jgi:hypothetical protein
MLSSPATRDIALVVSVAGITESRLPKSNDHENELGNGSIGGRSRSEWLWFLRRLAVIRASRFTAWFSSGRQPSPVCKPMNLTGGELSGPGHV